MKKLRQISVIGMGLLGSSVTLAVLRSFSSIRTVGYSHRASTRKKARDLGVAEKIAEDLLSCVRDSDLVIIATPICTFEDIFEQIAPDLKDGCVVTDVGSTKKLAHQWARKRLGKTVHYVGSHPIAGSEKRGVEFARDDLFFGAKCIVTKDKNTNAAAVRCVKEFWSSLGCSVSVMNPAEHDKVFADVSHVPHAMAAALVNATDSKQINFAGKGFVDTSRIASGPANVWADIFMTNSANTAFGIEKVISQLRKLQSAIKQENYQKTLKLLEDARSKREKLIKYKMKKNELI
ncbi:MAG: prephenate dehydrogenase [Planctomycetes bacterium]|nr:prephenate dehydrogenase [Planctomycetota bacterium]